MHVVDVLGGQELIPMLVFCGPSRSRVGRLVWRCCGVRLCVRSPFKVTSEHVQQGRDGHGHVCFPSSPHPAPILWHFPGVLSSFCMQ